MALACCSRSALRHVLACLCAFAVIYYPKQYGPQLYETWRHGSAGSLSYATYTLQTVGSAAIVFNNAVLNHDDWYEWSG